jgi:Fe2+ or Zn2+ uptake regulation protein
VRQFVEEAREEARANHANRLHEAGLKVTKTRLAILDLVADERRHVTADELTAALRRGKVPADRVTVYRNIDRMIRAGLLITTHMPGKALRVGYCSRPGGPHHHHIVCCICGRVAELQGCVVRDAWTELQEDVRNGTGFELTGHRLQFFGTCAECQSLPAQQRRRRRDQRDDEAC